MDVSALVSLKVATKGSFKGKKTKVLTFYTFIPKEARRSATNL